MNHIPACLCHYFCLRYKFTRISTPYLMITSNTAIIRPKITETATTAAVCLVSDFLSGQIILSNSAFKPANQLALGAFCELLSPISSHFLCFVRLFRFFVQCVGPAESAVLLRLHSVRMGFFVFCHVVIPLFTFGTC